MSFPTGFSESSRTVTGISCIAGQDISVTVPSVQLPSIAKTYGPLVIMTRVSESGNIVDMNKVFTNIPVANAKPAAKANSLLVSFTDQNSIYVSSLCSLIFSFNLSEDL